MPDEVTNGLQRAQKPHKTGVRATLRKEVEREEKEGMQMEAKTGRKGEEKGGVTRTKEGRDEGRGETEGDS